MRPTASLRTLRRPITTERRAASLLPARGQRGRGSRLRVTADASWPFTLKSPTRRWKLFSLATTSAASVSFKGIAEGVENSNYLLHADAGQFILTLYEKRVKESDLPFFIGLMEHLAAARRHLPAAGQGEERRGARPPVRPRRGDRHLSRRRLAASAAGGPLRPGRRSAGAHARGRRRLHAVSAAPTRSTSTAGRRWSPPPRRAPTKSRPASSVR